MNLRVKEVGVQTSGNRELALSGLTRRLRQLIRLSTYLHMGERSLV